MGLFEKDEHVKVTLSMIVAGPVESVRPVVKLYHMVVLLTELILPPVVGWPNFYFKQIIQFKCFRTTKDGIDIACSFDERLRQGGYAYLADRTISATSGNCFDLFPSKLRFKTSHSYVNHM